MSSNLAPVFVPASFNLSENSGVSTFVGNVTVFDPDGHSLTVRLGSGGQGVFAVSTTGVITVVGGPLDYESTPVVTLQVEATDMPPLGTAALVRHLS